MHVQSFEWACLRLFPSSAQCLDSELVHHLIYVFWKEHFWGFVYFGRQLLLTVFSLPLISFCLTLFLVEIFKISFVKNLFHLSSFPFLFSKDQIFVCLLVILLPFLMHPFIVCLLYCWPSASTFFVVLREILTFRFSTSSDVPEAYNSGDVHFTYWT